MIKCTECSVILKGRRKIMNANKTFRCVDCSDAVVTRPHIVTIKEKEKASMVVAKPSTIKQVKPKLLEPVDTPVIVNAQVAPPSFIHPVGQARSEPTVPRIELGVEEKKRGRPKSKKKNEAKDSG